LHNILIFCLALALNEHELKVPVLANTLSSPHFIFSQHFEQWSCILPCVLNDTQFLMISFEWLHVFIQ